MRSELTTEMSKAIRQMIQVLPASRKLVRNSVSLVDKKPQFEIDLRVEGVPQDAILEDEEQMEEVNKKLENFAKWTMHKIAFVTIWRKRVIWSSSEESSRAIHEMGNLELDSNWDKPRRLFSVLLAWSTYQRDWPCVYVALRLRPNQETMDRIKARVWSFDNAMLSCNIFIHDEERTRT